jgi:hypothetical protein
MYRTRLSIVAISCTITAQANAQSVMQNPSQWYVNNQIYSLRVFHSAIANSTTARRAGAGGPNRPGRPAPAPVEPTVYRESANSTVPARLAATGAGDRVAAERMFATYIADYKRAARLMQYPHNDLAFAYTYYVVSNYAVYHDLLDVPYEKDPRALRAGDGFDRITAMSQKRLLLVTKERLYRVFEQFRTQLADDPDVKRMTDAQKQEATEQLAAMYGVNRAAYMAGIDAVNERQTQVGRDLARAGLERMLGVPITYIGITHIGLDLSPP